MLNDCPTLRLRCMRAEIKSIPITQHPVECLINTVAFGKNTSVLENILKAEIIV